MFLCSLSAWMFFLYRSSLHFSVFVPSFISHWGCEKEQKTESEWGRYTRTKTAKKHPGCFHSSRVTRISKAPCRRGKALRQWTVSPPVRDLLVCHTSFSLLIWLNIVDILLIVFRSSVLNTVRHSRKYSFFLFFISSSKALCKMVYLCKVL